MLAVRYANESEDVRRSVEPVTVYKAMFVIMFCCLLQDQASIFFTFEVRVSSDNSVANNKTSLIRLAQRLNINQWSIINSVLPQTNQIMHWQIKSQQYLKILLKSYLKLLLYFQ